LSIIVSLGQTRWLIAAQRTNSVSEPLLVVLVAWLTIIFISFGLFAPRTVTVIVSLLVSALSVSGAIFLILEMYSPYAGLIHVSSGPLRAALAHLGQ
jgi:membrane-bound ClpP family serine protease